jgi:class 3 adenylate cyclase/pimeloyl-ACP methyl ester carboxylesterase
VLAIVSSIGSSGSDWGEQLAMPPVRHIHCPLILRRPGDDHVPVTAGEPDYVRTDDGAYIAFAVLGDGPVDIAWQFDWTGNLDCVADSPTDEAWFAELASFSRVVLHDRRATGLSTRQPDPPNLETRAADLRTVLNHVSATHPVIGGWFEGLAPGVLLAATDPDMVRGLVWWNPTPRTMWAPDYPWGDTQEEAEREIRSLATWGTLAYGQAWADAFQTYDARPADYEIRGMAKISRNTCTPDVALAMDRVWRETDLRSVLPTVRVPTLLLADAPWPIQVERARYVASMMPSAELLEIELSAWPSREDLPFALRPHVDAVRQFVGLEPTRQGLDTVLASVLFTDIAGSTERQAAMGDHAWKGLVERHHTLVRGALAQWRGVENDTAGDGFYATFDGPARAIRCAMEITARALDLGVQVRAGIHTGECEIIDGKVGGIAVSIGARISALAEPQQVLISQTVKDLVAGSGLTFTSAGEHELKGVPDRWRLYSVAG